MWARLGIPHPPTAVDGLIAATAIVHGLTVVTRNVADLTRTGVTIFDPFASHASGGDRGGVKEQHLTDDEMDLDWSRRVASLATDALMTAGILPKESLDRATAIAAEEIHVRLALHDRPDRENWRYKSD